MSFAAAASSLAMFLLAFLALALGACSQNELGSPPPEIPRHETLSTELVKEVTSIYSNEALEDCDKRVKDDVL